MIDVSRITKGTRLFVCSRTKEASSSRIIWDKSGLWRIGTYYDESDRGKEIHYIDNKFWHVYYVSYRHDIVDDVIELSFALVAEEVSSAYFRKTIDSDSAKKCISLKLLDKLCVSIGHYLEVLKLEKTEEWINERDELVYKEAQARTVEIVEPSQTNDDFISEYPALINKYRVRKYPISLLREFNW